jgi:hypothetical protein
MQLDLLTSLSGDTPASLSVSPGSAEARKMTATSGRKLVGSWLPAGPLGACLRTLLGTSAWASTTCFLTWQAKATPAGRSLFQLAPSMPRTDATGFGLLPTATAMDSRGARNMTSGRKPNSKHHDGMTLSDFVMLWPTPNASDSKGPNPLDRRPPCDDDLPTAVARAMWPTPASRDYRHPNAKPFAERGGGSKGEQLPNAAGGPLNPTWVEWLMGYPAGWTDCGRSETRSSRRSLR